MKEASKTARAASAAAEKQLEGFIGKFEPKHQALIRATRKALLGSGRQNRFVRLDSAATLTRPEVDALITAAVSQAKMPLPATARGTLIIRSISKKQRPRSR